MSDEEPTEEFIPEECEACQAPDVLLTRYDRMGIDNRTVHLCELCAATPGGNLAIYPMNPHPQSDVLQTLCFVGNAILKAIKEAK